MKTQEQLSKMTEQELTFELACLVFGDDNAYMDNFGKVGVTTEVYYVDINDWSWLMPLAVEHGLSLVRLDSSAYAATNNPESYLTDSNYRFKENGGISSWDGSPQRAIATCLILKLQEIKE